MKKELFQLETGLRVGERKKGGNGKGMKKEIGISSVHVPTPHREIRRCILQTCSNF